MSNAESAENTVSIPDRKQVKSQAKDILSNGNNQLTLAVSLLIFITASVTCLYVGYMLIYAFGYKNVSDYSLGYWLLNIGYVLWVALTALFGNIPILYGIYAVTMRMCKGESVKIADVFEVFSESEYYAKALKLSCRTVMKYIVQFAVVCFFPNTWVKLLAILVSLAVAFFIGSDFGLAFATLKDTDRKNYGKTNYGATGNGGRIVSFKLSFIPWILLSAATVGVLFVIHTVPYIMISNTLYYGGLEVAVKTTEN